MLTIFVSSTWKDLQPERDAVEKAIHRIREARFVGMEYFGSREDTPRDVSLAEVDRSDFYIGIFGERYGSGITEDEYRRARQRNLPCHIYFKDEEMVAPDGFETEPTNIARLDALKADLRKFHAEAPNFTNPDQLATLVATDLHRWLVDKYLTPRLEQAAQGTLEPQSAQSLIRDIRDWKGFNPDLLARLQRAGFNVNVASKTGNITVGGNTSNSILNTGNVGNIKQTVITHQTANGDLTPAQILADFVAQGERIKATLNATEMNAKIKNILLNDLETALGEARDVQPSKSIIEAKLKSMESIIQGETNGNLSDVSDAIHGALNLVQQLR